jgi:citrate lyase subunit gamma (acyl carrier protein)
MDIKKIAVAGTLESSDCMVTIEPGSNGIEFDLESVVIRQYGKQIRKVTLETLDRLGISNAKIRMVDKGALDCTIKARVECAVFRASEYEGRVDWGGAVR